MATTKSWTDQQDAELVALHGQGLTQAECGRRLGISNRRVSEHSKVIGLAWDRSKTMAATSARVADNRALRTQISSQALVEAQGFLADLHKPALVFNFGGKDNTYEERWHDRPSHEIRLKIMQSFGVAVDRSLKIDVHDADMGGVAAVDRWLTHMTEGEASDGGSAPDREGA